MGNVLPFPRRATSATDNVATPDGYRHELCDWETELAYANGFEAGYARAQANVHAALRYALGGADTPNWTAAADRHSRTVAARALRRLVDTFGPRAGDYLGGPVEWETGRPLRATPQPRDLKSVAA